MKLKRDFVSAVEFVDGWSTPLTKHYLKDVQYMHWLCENQRKAWALMGAI